MSYFIVTIGKKPDFKHLAGVTIIPLSQAQQYIKDRAGDLLAGRDSSELFIICDPAVQGSVDIVPESEGLVHRGNTLESTTLGQVIAACVAAGNSLRIWWATNDPQAHQKVISCGDLSSFKETLLEQIRTSSDIAVLYTPRNRKSGDT